MNKKFVNSRIFNFAILVFFAFRLLGQEIESRVQPLASFAGRAAISSILASMDNQETWRLKRQELARIGSFDLIQLVHDLKAQYLPWKVAQIKLGMNKMMFTSTDQSPTDARIHVDSYKNVARIYVFPTRNLLHTLQGHTARVKQVQFSRDGSQIVTSSCDNTARIWNTQSGLCTNILRGHTQEVYTANFSKDGRQIITASKDRTARIWDTRSGDCLHVLQLAGYKINSAYFLDRVKQIVTIDESRLTSIIWMSAHYCQIREVKAGQAGPAQAGPLDGPIGQEFLQLLLQAKFNNLHVQGRMLQAHDLAHLYDIWMQLPVNGREQLLLDYQALNLEQAMMPVPQ